MPLLISQLIFASRLTSQRISIARPFHALSLLSATQNIATASKNTRANAEVDVSAGSSKSPLPISSDFKSPAPSPTDAISSAVSSRPSALVEPRSSALGATPGPRQYSEKARRIASEILQLSLLEVADLNDIIKRELGLQNVSFAAPVAAPSVASLAAATAPVAAAAKPGATEPADDVAAPAASIKSMTLKLVKFDEAKKIALIREIKNIVPGLNLVQSKKLVESVPSIIRKDLTKEESEKLRKQIEANGGTVELE